jgi:hypothetical protein
MEFFNPPHDIPETINQIDIDTIPSNTPENQLYKFLLNEMQRNSYLAEAAFDVGLLEMADIPDLSLDDWILLISFIHNKTKEQLLFKFLKKYENTITDEQNREALHTINEELRKIKFSTGGKRTRKNKRRCKKRSKRRCKK